MSTAVLEVHFHRQETLRNLERAAEALGVSADQLAEVAIERELAALGSGLEDRLSRALEGLQSYGPADLDRDLQRIAQSEGQIADPLQAHRMDSPDAYGIGALFGHPLERG